MQKDEIPHMVSVMTPFPHHIEASAPLTETESMMQSHDIHHLPVMDEGDIVGLISEQDLKRISMPGHPLREETELITGDLCTIRPYLVDVSDPLDRVLEVMHAKHLDSVLVLREGELAGIFTAIDACRLLATFIEEHAPHEPDDVIA